LPPATYGWAVAPDWGHNLRPQYLHGRTVTIIAKEGEKWVVRLEEPVGRFTNADIRLFARQLEPV
jgi:hypothetical protein